MGRIPEETISQIIDRCDIVDIVSSYVPLKKSGRNFKGLSPFKNEKTPSFVVSPDKQIFHCFSSGEGGNVVSFIMKMERMEFLEAIRLLAEKTGVVIPNSVDVNPKTKSLREALYHINALAADFYHHNLLSGTTDDAKRARKYLKARGINLEMVKKFKLGFSYDRWDSLLLYLRKKEISLSLIEKAGLIIPREKRDGYYDRFRNRILFPIFDVRNRAIAFGGRSLEDTGAKYINSPESEIYTKGRHLYGLHLSKDDVAKLDQVIVTEGYMDFVMPYQAGATNVVASLGTALTTEQIRLLRRYTRNVVMLFDTDQAGIQASLRSCDLLIEEGMNIKIASLDKGEDPDSFIRKNGLDSFYERINAAKTLFEFKLAILLSTHNKESVSGRAEICNEMLTTVNKYENAIVRSEYIKCLAQTLSVSQEAIIEELKKKGTSQSPWQEKKNIEPKKDVKNKKQKAEYKVLKILLNNQRFISSTKEDIKLSDFQDESVRKIIAKLYEVYDENNDFSTASLVSNFQDTDISGIITNLLADEREDAENLEKIHHDCVARIKDDSLKIQRSTLLVQIREAEEAGKNEELEKLKSRFINLIK